MVNRRVLVLPDNVAVPRNFARQRRIATQCPKSLLKRRIGVFGNVPVTVGFSSTVGDQERKIVAVIERRMPDVKKKENYAYRLLDYKLY